MKKESEKTNAKERERSISLTVSQLKEMREDEKLSSYIIGMIEKSEGNLKGNTAFHVAKELIKQLEMAV